MADNKVLTPEERIAALESALELQNKTIKAIPDQSRKVAALESTISSLNATIRSLSDQSEKVAAFGATLDQQKKTIKALTDQLDKVSTPGKVAKAEKPKIPEETFTVDNRDFKFVLAEFSFKNHKISAVDALVDKDILKALVKMQSGVIEEIH